MYKQDFQQTVGTLRFVNFMKQKDPERERLDCGEMTPIEYGTSVIESFKAVCHPTFLTCLSKSSSSMDPAEVKRVLEEAYQECIESIAADPEQYNLDVAFWYILARKK